MSDYSELQRMQPVAAMARQFDIATQSAPDALFEDVVSGVNIWCTPDDHPMGWERVQMQEGTFGKPCQYVASLHWGWQPVLMGWEAERITHLELSTDTYSLGKFRAAGRSDLDFHNRPADVQWAKAKIAWLFERAGVRCPPIVLSDD